MSGYPVEGWDVPRGYYAPDEPTAYEESLYEQLEELERMEMEQSPTKKPHHFANRKPEFPLQIVHNLSVEVYKMRLVDDSGQGAVERMIKNDKDNGENLSGRARSFDILSRCYLRALKNAGYLTLPPELE